MDTEMNNWTEQQLRELMHSVYQQEKEADKKGKQTLTEEEIKKYLLAQTDESCREFETTLVKYAVDWDDKTIIKNTLKNMVEAFRQDQTKVDERVAFAAFCVMVNYERRMKNASAEKQLLDEYETLFNQHIFYLHMRLLSDMEEMESFKHRPDGRKTREILERAELNAKNLCKNEGGTHAFAETVALAYETVPDVMKEIEQSQGANWLNSGINAVEKCIELSNGKYAKYYCTYARLLAIEGNYDAALSKLNEAVDKEDNKRPDYSIRIGRYISYIQQFRASKQMKASEEEFRVAMEKQESQTIVKNMEFLGLFSGLVSFTIGSLSISGAVANQSIKHAAGLIVVLMGALMAVFAAFGIILHGIWGKKALRNLVVLLMGAAIVVGGILFCLN